MGLALNEGEQKNERAIEFYNVLSQFLFHLQHADPLQFRHNALAAQLLLPLHRHGRSRAISSKSSPTMRSSPNGPAASATTGPTSAPQAPHQRDQRQKPRRHPLPKSRQRHSCSSEPVFCSRHSDLYSKRRQTDLRMCMQEISFLASAATYREVTEKFTYNQKDPMVAITIKHSIEPISRHSGPSLLCDPRCSHGTGQ